MYAHSTLGYAGFASYVVSEEFYNPKIKIDLRF